MIETLVILFGRSGVGKTTVQRMLCERCGFSRLVTTTTRMPRPDETSGIDYHFRSREEFTSLEMVFRSEIFGSLYGIELQAIEASASASSTVVLVAAPEGVTQLLQLARTCIPISLQLVDGSSAERLRPDSFERMKSRQEDDENLSIELGRLEQLTTVFVDRQLPEDVVSRVIGLLEERGVNCTK